MGKLEIRNYVIGMIQTNCYLVCNREQKEAVILDPADYASYIAEQCRKLDVRPVAVLLTHGHGDHISAVPELVTEYSVSVYAGKEEAALLADPSLNLSSDFGKGISIKAVQGLEDGQELLLLGCRWKVITTPGHTAGSVCYYLEEEKALFSGDTLFYESYGRTDFPTGNASQLTHSITEKLLVLPENVTVYPGHESQTTIGHERTYNPLAVYRRF